MSIIDTNIISFLDKIQPLCYGKLGQLQKESLEKNLPIIKPDTARLISFILSIKRPKRILEIGCCVGFSAALMTQYLKKDGKLTTIERYELMQEKALKNFETLGISHRIKMLKGDALDILPTLKRKYDFIFLDAAKGQYIQMLPHCLRLLKKDGILVADDVLQEGRVASDRLSIPRRQRTIHKRMGDFLYAISNTEGLVTSILTIDDGVTVTLKTKDFKELNLPTEN